MYSMSNWIYIVLALRSIRHFDFHFKQIWLNGLDKIVPFPSSTALCDQISAYMRNTRADLIQMNDCKFHALTPEKNKRIIHYTYSTFNKQISFNTFDCLQLKNWGKNNSSSTKNKLIYSTENEVPSENG